MTTIILITALTQIPLELHTVRYTTEGRFIIGCIEADIRVVDEGTSAARYYQQCLRESVVFRDSLDCFVKIGQQKTRIPATAFDSHRMMILTLKAEVDRWNDIQRNHYQEKDVFYWLADGRKWHGMPKTVYPYPWQRGYADLPWNPPSVQPMTRFSGVSGVQMETPDDGLPEVPE